MHVHVPEPVPAMVKTEISFYYYLECLRHWTKRQYLLTLERKTMKMKGDRAGAFADWTRGRYADYYCSFLRLIATVATLYVPHQRRKMMMMMMMKRRKRM